MSQDAEVGDGTTSVVLLAGEFLRECKPYIEEGIHPQVIVKAFRDANKLAIKRLEELAIHLNADKPEERRDMLEKSAMTSLNSKLVSGHKEFFAKMVRRPTPPPRVGRPSPFLPPSRPCALRPVSLIALALASLPPRPHEPRRTPRRPSRRAAPPPPGPL